MIRTGPGTLQKYEILAAYLPALSLIMRNNGYEHYLIDACAGSGIVRLGETDQIIDGSPLIMAKTREQVQSRIRDKTKEPQAKCIFIEFHPKTFSLLEKTMVPFSAYCHSVHGDCNEKLDVELDRITSDLKSRNHFAFVYIDPFGLGAPTIMQDTLRRILERSFTELFVHFSWEGVSRVAGMLSNLDSPDERLRKTARSQCDTLDIYLTPAWREIEARKLPPNERQVAYVSLYKTTLQEYYSRVNQVEIPAGAKDPDYYLFFATRNSTGEEIMKNIIIKVRRRGTESLQKYFSEM
jgi:three-Cys-motif partner protein